MKCSKDRILFLLRQSNLSSGYSTSATSKAGLSNSARMTMAQLQENFGLDGSLRICFDSNQIDREVTEFRPKFVVIEAIWVPPYKFKELVKLHPTVHFIVRVHSELPFLANEGIAMEFLKGYVGIPKVHITFNSKHASSLMEKVLSVPVFYLPNIYENVLPVKEDFLEMAKLEFMYRLDDGNTLTRRCTEIINIGCFGAIRPMKNQLQQAAAAIAFGEKHNKMINFCINSGRVEQQGENVLKNLRALFHGTDHALIEYRWLDRKDFLGVLSTMHLNMQLSLNESFNIVAADSVSMYVPVVVSDTIEWMPSIAKASTEDYKNIVNVMTKAINNQYYFLIRSTNNLTLYNKRSIKQWGRTLF